MVAWDVGILWGSFISTCILLNLKAHISYVSLITSRIAIKGMNPPTKEDREALARNEKLSSYVPEEGFEHPDVRLNAILVNENQGFLFFLLVALAFMATAELARGTTLYRVSAVVGPILFLLYAMSRYLWFVMYLAALQPWRTLLFALGNLIQIVIGLYTIIALILTVSIY